MNDNYPLALPEGSVLAGQYIIQKVLGQGGFGITYMAIDYKTNQKVAIKEFFPDTLASRTGSTVSSYPGERTDSFQYGKACFLQEAETLAAFIGSENIVKIHSYFEENGTAYFVMDFVEGISFDEYIRQKGGKIDYDDAERILLHIIDALALVHSRRIVHRDVTPDNIYITNDGTVKLLDFGAARYSLGDKSRSLDVVLKHGFAPKEQYTRHGRQGPFTDVYTVGASFYFAITGKRPPDSIDRLEEDDLVPPSSLGVNLPPWKEDAILKAMSVQPGDRFQTMGEFKQALLGAGSMQNGTAASSGVTNQKFFTAPQPGITGSIGQQFSQERQMGGQQPSQQTVTGGQQPSQQTVTGGQEQPPQQTVTGGREQSSQQTVTGGQQPSQQTVTGGQEQLPQQTVTGGREQSPQNSNPRPAGAQRWKVPAIAAAAALAVVVGIFALANRGKDEEESMSANKQTEKESDLLASNGGQGEPSDWPEEQESVPESPSRQEESSDWPEESESVPEAPDGQEEPADWPKGSGSASEESAAPSSEPSVPSDNSQKEGLYEEIRGNTPDNIKNQGTAAMSEDGLYLYYRSYANLRMMDSNKTDTLLSEDVSPVCISCIGDYVYYVNEDDGAAYRVSREGGTPEMILYFQGYSIATLYISDSYYFATVYNDAGTLLVRVDRSQLTNTGQVPLGDYRQVTFASGYMYYVGTVMVTAQDGTEIECPCIYRVPTGGDWAQPENWCYYIGDAEHTAYALDELCSEGNTIYVINRGKLAQGYEGADSSGWAYRVSAFTAREDGSSGWDLTVSSWWGLPAEFANYNYEVQSPVVFKGDIYYIAKVQKSEEETDYSVRRMDTKSLTDDPVATSNRYHGGLSVVPTFNTSVREREAFLSEFFYMIGRQTIMTLEGEGIQMLDE